MQETTTIRLQERQSTPQTLNNSEELFNFTDQNTPNHREDSKSGIHVRSGYNSQKRARMSRHSVFVLDVNGKPLTPCKSSKARKLLKGKQAKPVWNKFGRFGIQMLVETRKEHPETKLGYDLGTKFEGHSVVCGKENNLSVMWKLPDKKKIVCKLKERSQLRRARRFRNCRRRPCRSNNRGKDGFIAPGQNVIVESRLKALKELFRCYPIDISTVEDVKFNHRDKRWGKNFSTAEIGKAKLYGWIRKRSKLILVKGHETQEKRKKLGYRKTRDKGAEKFTAHCTDALTLATDTTIMPGDFVVVDDSYRPVRRRLHDTQFSKGGVRHLYSSGNFRSIRKGTMCEYGQICGGTKNNVFIRDVNNKRIGRVLSKIGWLSHTFKTSIPSPIKMGGLLEVT